MGVSRKNRVTFDRLHLKKNLFGKRPQKGPHKEKKKKKVSTASRIGNGSEGEFLDEDRDSLVVFREGGEGGFSRGS